MIKWQKLTVFHLCAQSIYWETTSKTGDKGEDVEGVEGNAAIRMSQYHELNIFRSFTSDQA